AEFIRVLAPGGVLLFQLTARRRETRLFGKLKVWLGKVYYGRLWKVIHPRKPFMAMYGIPREAVAETIAAQGGRVVEIAPDGSAGPRWESYQYLVTRDPRENTSESP